MCNTRPSFRHSLLVGLYELGAEPRHLHDLQQGLQESVQKDTVQVMFGLCVLLSMRRQQDTIGAGESSTWSVQRTLVLLC